MAELKPDPKNARRHTPRNRDLIRRSLQEVGPFRSIGVDGEGIVRAGNGVYEQAQQLGLKIRVVEAAPDELIAVKRPDLTGAAAERAALYDNQAGELSEWDTGVLAQIASEAPQVLDGIFDDGDLAAMLAEAGELDQVEADLMGEGREKAPDLKSGLGDTNAKIKPVIYARDLADFERAIRATGLPNRGEALMRICRFYLEHYREQAG